MLDLSEINQTSHRLNSFPPSPPNLVVSQPLRECKSSLLNTANDLTNLACRVEANTDQVLVFKVKK